MERNYYLLAFESTHAAMAAQRGLAGRVPVQVVPTLRQVSASCGISLRVEERDAEGLEQALEEGRVEPETCRFYRVEGDRVRELPPGAAQAPGGRFCRQVREPYSKTREGRSEHVESDH